MSTMISEVYDALRDAGADEAKARAAAEAVASYNKDIADLKASLVNVQATLSIIKWMNGFMLAFILALVWRTFG